MEPCRGSLLLDMFKKLTEPECRSVILDMESIQFLDTSDLSAIMAINQEIRARCGYFALLNVSDTLMDFLHLATLNGLFAVLEGYEDLP